MSGANVVCCPLGGNDEEADFSTTKVRRARRAQACCECKDPILPGARYEHTSGLWGGVPASYKTCLSCVEIRTHFECNGWIYECLWSDLEDNFFPEMKAGGPCMKGLSPAAKARLFERCLAWKERIAERDQQMEHGILPSLEDAP